jgi:hypothetical protein
VVFLSVEVKRDVGGRIGLRRNCEETSRAGAIAAGGGLQLPRQERRACGVGRAARALSRSTGVALIDAYVGGACPASTPNFEPWGSIVQNRPALLVGLISLEPRAPIGARRAWQPLHARARAGGRAEDQGTEAAQRGPAANWVLT